MVQGLTLWRWCVGPAPAQGELPGQGGAMLGMGWGRWTGPCKAQGAGAARPADGRGPGDIAGVRKRVPQPRPVRAMGKARWLVPSLAWSNSYEVGSPSVRPEVEVPARTTTSPQGML